MRIIDVEPQSYGQALNGMGHYITGPATLLTVICHGQLATAGSKTGYPRQGKDGKIHVAMVDQRRPNLSSGRRTGGTISRPRWSG